MGATMTTANYNLSQFVGTDKPAWLQDYNGDMLKIDTGINAAKVAADGAQNSASAAQNDATTANDAITNTINPAISSLNTTVGNQGGSINTINSLIGNGTPTTTDQTIIGAINEINAKVTEDTVIVHPDTFSSVINVTSWAKEDRTRIYLKNMDISGIAICDTTKSSITLQLKPSLVSLLDTSYIPSNDNIELGTCFNYDGSGNSRPVQAIMDKDGAIKIQTAQAGNLYSYLAFKLTIPLA